jgi:hypothetical protein
MDIVNEKTTYRIVVEFIAEDGAPVVPSSGVYRLDDVLSGEEAIADTPFVPGGSSFVVTIPFAANEIINNSNDLEEKVFTVVAEYGVGKQCTGEYRYKVRNLLKLT